MTAVIFSRAAHELPECRRSSARFAAPTREKAADLESCAASDLQPTMAAPMTH